MAVNKSAQGELKRIKANVSQSYLYFKDNVTRYNDYRYYAYNTTVNEDQRSLLQSQSKPVVEFNIVEAYLSRLLGEFAKHEPSITVTPAEGVPVPFEVIDVIEGHIRHYVYEANKDSMSYEVYKDLLSGGFSVIKVWTEYASPMSMKQVIRVGRCFDPTLCGFDPMGRASHKADGKYSFELFPMKEEDFKRDYPGVDLVAINYLRSFEEFSWAYKNDKGEAIVLVCDYYEKKERRTQIVELADGTVMPVSAYKKLGEFWEQQQFIEQVPVVKGKPRWTTLETICRYKIVDTEVIEYEETDYTYLPHIFVDGNSIILRQGTSGVTYQMTRPYIYNAKGIQDLKNFSGQALANYLENLIQHKFIVKKEALPQEEDYLQALTDMQHANTIVVNAFSENDPTQMIPDPIVPIVNVAAPPEVMGTFQAADPTTQTILGSYASNLGQNDNDLSGKAVIESASVGNAASMPYITGYLQAWSHLGCVIVDLLPKYMKGPRDLPIVKLDGEKEYAKVNVEGHPKISYQQNALNVCIDAGVNFQIQKNQALQQITSLMQASPEFAAFMNDDEALPILVDNLTIYGADRIKQAVPKWIEKKNKMQAEQKQQQQQMMQMQMQQMQQTQAPQMMRAQAELQKVQMQGEQNQVENQLEIAKIAIDKELADAKILEAEAKVSQAQVDSAVRLEESETSLHVHALESATKMAEIQSRQHDDKLKYHKAHLSETELLHKIEQSKKGDGNGEVHTDD